MSASATFARTFFDPARVAKTCLSGTRGERALQEAIAERLEKSGHEIEWQPFAFPRHIYGCHALHFGLALAFVALARFQPLAAAAGELFVAFSFYSEVVWRRSILRKLWPRTASQNLIVTKRARGTMRRRVVFVAHADSAYTGFMFKPAIVPLIAKPSPVRFLEKQLRLPWFCVLALAAWSVGEWALGLPFWPSLIFALPPFLVFALNGEVVVRNTVVPGAADNLSGCAAQVALAEAWAARPPSDLEVVWVFSGCEEAGAGGATHPARTSGWSPKETTVLVLDTLTNGTLFMLEEGELFRERRPTELGSLVTLVAAGTSQRVPTWYTIPAGATDALPFLREGFEALALTCVDESIGAPRNYHHPNDTADRADPAQLERSTRLVESILHELAKDDARSLDLAAE